MLAARAAQAGVAVRGGQGVGAPAPARRAGGPVHGGAADAGQLVARQRPRPTEGPHDCPGPGAPASSGPGEPGLPGLPRGSPCRRAGVSRGQCQLAGHVLHLASAEAAAGEQGHHPCVGRAGPGRAGQDPGRTREACWQAVGVRLGGGARPPCRMRVVRRIAAKERRSVGYGFHRSDGRCDSGELL